MQRQNENTADLEYLLSPKALPGLCCLKRKWAFVTADEIEEMVEERREIKVTRKLSQSVSLTLSLRKSYCPQ